MSAEQNRTSLVAMRWMIAGEWAAHPARVIVAALAIAVGVALGFAVHLINASALNEFTRAIKTVNGDAELQVHAVTPLGFEESLYPKLARLPGIAGASPVVEINAVADTADHPSVTLLGLDVLRAAAVTPSLVGERLANSAPTAKAQTGEEDGPAPSTSDEAFDTQALFLSQSALEATGKRIGETIQLSADGRTLPFTIAGTLPGVADNQNIAVMDIAAAQWRFSRLGRLQRIDLKLADGADATRLRNAVAAILPANAEIVDQETETRRTDSLSRAYRVNLDMLALMALLTGAFLAFSAQALSVARRRSQFALLRVLGVQRRAILFQVLAEGAVGGGIGALVGLGLGLGLAAVALRLLGGDLGGGYFYGTRPQLIFAPAAAFGFLILGVLAALLGSVLPARDAARAQPAVALQDAGGAADANAIPGALIPLAPLNTGAVPAFLPAVCCLPPFALSFV